MTDWTEAKIETLRRLWAEGLSAAEIGRRLRTTKNSIVGKAHRLKLDGRPLPIRAPQPAQPGRNSRVTPVVSGARRLPPGALPPRHRRHGGILRRRCRRAQRPPRPDPGADRKKRHGARPRRAAPAAPRCRRQRRQGTGCVQPAPSRRWGLHPRRPSGVGAYPSARRVRPAGSPARRRIAPAAPPR